MPQTLPVMLRSSVRPTSDGLHAMPAAALPIILDEKLKKVQRSLLAELDFTTWSKSTPSAPATQLALIFSAPPSAAAEIRSRLADVSHEEGREGGREGEQLHSSHIKISREFGFGRSLVIKT